MPGELIPHGELEKSANGYYKVSYQQLLQLTIESQTEIEAAIQQLINTNSEYEFRVSDDRMFDGGLTIAWRRRHN